MVKNRLGKGHILDFFFFFFSIRIWSVNDSNFLM